MGRYPGKTVINYTYNVNDYRPLDTRMLVPTYADLMLESNWTVKGESNTYNGMIVAVGSNTADLTKNGIYYLFDAANPSADDVPDVTNEANWHKLAELSELDAFVGRLSALQDELAALDARVTALEEGSDVITYGYRKDFPLVGEAGKMYVAEDLKRTYVWANNQYVVVGAGFEEDDSGALLINGGSAD
jgi:hypothetical protein